jgi:ferredoxin
MADKLAAPDIDALLKALGVDLWGATANDPPLPRNELYDAKACEVETERYPDLGGVCGVCIAVCPRGRKSKSSGETEGGAG